MNIDETVTNIQRKIDREKALITAANAMRQSTNNPAVLSRLDGQIRDGRRNIEYFENTLRDLEMRRNNARDYTQSKTIRLHMPSCLLSVIGTVEHCHELTGSAMSDCGKD